MIETDTISMEQLNQQVSQCTNCPLWTTRTQVITGEGNCSAPLMLLGEAPGGHEDMVSGQVFTGEAGQHLEEFLNYIGIERQDIYLTNTVKCRPTKPSPRGRYGPYSNRRPKASEIKACSHWLEQELKLVSPKIIVTLGTVPLSKILGRNIAMKDHHGKPFFSEGYQAWVFPLFHPASIIYNPKIQPLYYHDLAQLKHFMEMHRL